MNETNKIKGYPYRFIARIVIEAESPLAVGSGDKGIMTDALVAKDINGMPYIPGTTIAGVIRHAVGDKTDDKSSVFGYHKGKEGAGSRIIFSDAVMVGKKGKALDGIQTIDFSDDFYNHFINLPVRQHVRINELGTAEKGGKFDEQVVYKGTRFVFEIEYISKENDKKPFNNVLEQLNYTTFRLGGGTRKGFGNIKVISVQQMGYNLYDTDDRNLYLKKSTSLSDEWQVTKETVKEINDDAWTKYEMILQPQDFFLFGSGKGDEDADDTPVTESIITWSADDVPSFIDNCILIPASSVKGALAHRTAYYWNKKKEFYVGDPNAKTADECPAVIAIFGSPNEDAPQRGNIIIEDMISKPTPSKLFNHVKIDRFTGGAIAGALFTEKVTDARNLEFSLTILVKVSEENRTFFELALNDLKCGLLPLGGSSNRGLGMFKEIDK